MCRVLAIVDKCVYSNYITATITTNKETKNEESNRNRSQGNQEGNRKRRNLQRISGMHRVAMEAISSLCNNEALANELAWEATKDVKLG